MCVSGNISKSQAAATKNVFQVPENGRAFVFQSNQALRSTEYLGRLYLHNQSPPTKEETEEKEGLVWVPRMKFHEVKLISSSVIRDLEP